MEEVGIDYKVHSIYELEYIGIKNYWNKWKEIIWKNGYH